MAEGGAGADQGPPAAGEAGVLAPGDQGWRDWAGGVPVEVLAKVAERLVATEARGHGLTLMVITAKGWKDTLKQDAIARAGGPEVWRDWGNLFGEGPRRAVLAKVAGKVVAQAEAGWVAQLKEWSWSEEGIQREMAQRKCEGNCLFIFARVCKEWRKAQLKVGGPLRSRVYSDVFLPGRAALAKWALAEGCPREKHTMRNMAHAAAMQGNLELVEWLCGEGGFAMDERVMQFAAGSGNLGLVQWLRGEGCPWNWETCSRAIGFGHVEVLRWVRENGCPWDTSIRNRAAAGLGYRDNFGNLVN